MVDFFEKKKVENVEKVIVEKMSKKHHKRYGKKKPQKRFDKVVAIEWREDL